MKEEYKNLAQGLTTEEALPGKVEILNDDVFGWDILKGPELDAKKLVRKLYDQTKTDGTFEKYKADFDQEDKLTSAGADKFVKQVLDEEDIEGDDIKIGEKVVHMELCVYLELLLRYYGHIKKDNQIWFLDTETMLINIANKKI